MFVDIRCNRYDERTHEAEKHFSLFVFHTLQSTNEVAFQLRKSLMERIAELLRPASAKDWTAEENRLRKQFLQDPLFHGWPKEGVESVTPL